MKIPVPIYLVALPVLLLHSCVSSRHAEREEAFLNSRQPSTGCFVEMKDGTVKNYNSLKLVTGIYQSPHLLADGREKIYPEDIAAYQNHKHYAVSSAGFSYGGHKSNIASETLPGFAVRVATGRLNVYVMKIKENNHVMDEFYFQEGRGQVIVYSPELMDALIKNEPEALDFFNNYRNRLQLTPELKATARIYNDSYFEKDKKGGEEKLLLAKGDKRKPK